MESLIDQLVKRFTKEVGIPYAFGILLKLSEHIAYQILGFLLGTDVGFDLGFNVRADHMDRLCRRAKLDPVAARLLNDARLLKMQILHIRHDDSIPTFVDTLECLGNLIVFFLDDGK